MNTGRQNELVKVRRQANRLIVKPFKYVFGLVVRTTLASIVFYVGMAVALHSMGYPVPRISDVGRYLENLSELSRILS